MPADVMGLVDRVGESDAFRALFRRETGFEPLARRIECPPAA